MSPDPRSGTLDWNWCRFSPASIPSFSVLVKLLPLGEVVVSISGSYKIITDLICML